MRSRGGHTTDLVMGKRGLAGGRDEIEHVRRDGGARMVAVSDLRAKEVLAPDSQQSQQ